MIWTKESLKLSTKNLIWWDRTEKLSSENRILPGFYLIRTVHISSAPLLVHFDKNIWGILLSDEGLLLMRWASFKSGLTLHWWNLNVMKLWSTLLWRNKLWSGESCEKPWDTGNIEAETGIKWRKWNSVYALTTSVKSTNEDSEEQLWTKNFWNC